MTAGTEQVARVAQNPLVVVLGRIGLIGYGVVNVLLAWLTARVAFGASEAEAEAGKGGAVQHIAETGWGAILLWVIGIGCWPSRSASPASARSASSMRGSAGREADS